MKYILIFLIPLFVHGIEIEYEINGKLHKIKGEALEGGKYLFNKGASKKIAMATLDWVPYIGENICNQGWVQGATIALLAQKDYEITSWFVPWNRALIMVETGQVDVLYPEYFIERSAPSDVHKGTKRRDHLVLSHKIPGGPIAFLKNITKNIQFDGDLKKLKGKVIGVVKGYQNTPELDALLDSGFIEKTEVMDDLQNARILSLNRVDLIVGDPDVITYTVKNSKIGNKKKKKILDNIDVVKPALKYNHLYYAFSNKTKKWEEKLSDLNDSIKFFNKNKLIEKIRKSYQEKCK